jgi:hypothetical protein
MEATPISGFGGLKPIRGIVLNFSHNNQLVYPQPR